MRKMRKSQTVKPLITAIAFAMLWFLPTLPSFATECFQVDLTVSAQEPKPVRPCTADMPVVIIPDTNSKIRAEPLSAVPANNPKELSLETKAETAPPKEKWTVGPNTANIHATDKRPGLTELNVPGLSPAGNTSSK